MALFGPDNLKGGNTHGNGLGPRTVVVSIAKTNITQDEMDTMLEALAAGGTYSGVTNDAFTVAGIQGDQTVNGVPNLFVAGTSDVVNIALQGTGTINADASNALGVTGAASAILCDFDQARACLLYTSPSPRDNTTSRMPSSA